MKRQINELPGTVFSMETPFSQAQISNLLMEQGVLDDGDLMLTIDLYLTNLVRHSILRQNGPFFYFRHINY